MSSERARDIVAGPVSLTGAVPHNSARSGDARGCLRICIFRKVNRCTVLHP